MLLPVGSQEVEDDIVPIFINFLTVGLVPPFFDFFLAVLEHFQLHMLHLHPNVVLVLAIFAHLCEGFVGVRPSLELFWHFYSPHPSSKDNQTSGCATIHLAKKKGKKNLIPMELYSHVKEWRRRWLPVMDLRGSPLLQEPRTPTPVMKRDEWKRCASSKDFSWCFNASGCSRSGDWMAIWWQVALRDSTSPPSKPGRS